jgi:hypothetical protein
LVEEVSDKGVWGHPSEAELLQLACWKVTQVPRENVRCVSGDSGCDDMTIIWIWQGYPRNVFLVPTDRRRRERIIHQPSGNLQTLYRNGRYINYQVSHPFIMDLIRPARFDQPIDCGLNDDIAEMKGIQNAGVEDRDGGLKPHSVA